MATHRAQVVFQGLSNVPEDVTVNTFHFVSPDATVAQTNLIRDYLIELYNVVPPSPASSNIGSFMGANISRATNSAKVKIYNLADPLPREPVTHSWTLTQVVAPVGTLELPAEVAVCASFYAGVNRPKYRGRVYLGPWHSMTLQDATNERSRPQQTLLDAIASAFGRLVAKPATGPKLAVQSSVDQTARVVTAGWVDDAWDTQRRRGQDAKLRVLFPTTI